MPTIIIFTNGKVIESIRDVNPPALRAPVQKIGVELARETAEQKPAEATKSAARQTSKGSEEGKTVSGAYSMTSGTGWKMAL